MTPSQLDRILNSGNVYLAGNGGSQARWSWRLTNSHGDDYADNLENMLDGLNTTSFKTGEANYPWIQVALKRKYLITKVAILSGEERLMNLEVRLGDIGIANTKSSGQLGNKRITENEKCGVFYGPTLVHQQWVEVDCGTSRGIKGRFLSLQLMERYDGNHPLEITRLEIYGWGTACGNSDPDSIQN